MNKRLIDLLDRLQTIKLKEDVSLKMAYKLNFKFINPVLTKPSEIVNNKELENRWYDSIESIPGEYLGYSDSIASRINHSGWLCDFFQDSKARGFVVRIRGKQDHIFLSCIELDYGVQLNTYSHDSKLDAALYADQLAESYAENARESNAKFQAEIEIEELISELHQLNRKTLAVIKELKSGFKVGQYIAICKLIHSHIEKTCERRTEIFERITALKYDFWLSVEGYY